MYISVIPWIFNIVLVGTIILLAGEVFSVRRDEREAYKQMLNSFGKNEQSVGSAKETSEDLNDTEDEEESMDGKNMIALTNSIKRWVKIRGIDRTHPQAQFIKVVEEVGEIAEGLAKKDKQLITDGVGDVYVTLVALCATLGLEIDECVYQAYKEIENRKGETVDGVFVKEEDL